MYDINLIKSHLLPIPVKERDFQPTDIKKAHQIVSFKFGDIQLLDIMIFRGDAISLDFSFKANKTNDRKVFFPCEWFDRKEKLNIKKVSSDDSFFSILLNGNPLENDYVHFENRLKSGLSKEQANAKLGMNNLPPTRTEKYVFLRLVWEDEHVQSFAVFLKWYNNNVVVPIVEAMQKMIDFHHNKGIDMPKLGCTIPNLAHTCLHKSQKLLSLHRNK